MTLEHWIRQFTIPRKLTIIEENDKLLIIDRNILHTFGVAVS